MARLGQLFAFANFANANFQSNNLTDDLIAKGLPRVNSVKGVSNHVETLPSIVEARSRSSFGGRIRAAT